MRRSCLFPSSRLLACLVLAASIALAVGPVTFLSAGTDGEYRKAPCAFNLMQLGKAIRMFADDHGGYICELTGRVSDQAKEGADNAQRLKAAYQPYIQDAEVWYCPADPYAKTHTLNPPEDQPDMKYDHHYTSYRHYPCISQEPTPARLDAVRMIRDEKTAALPSGVWIATPDMIMLMLDDGCYHGPAVTGEYGKVYGRNILFRDGRVKFETEETMRRPKQ